MFKQVWYGRQSKDGWAYGATIGGAGALTLSDLAKVRPQVMDQMGMVRCNVSSGYFPRRCSIAGQHMLWVIQDIGVLSKLGAPKMDRVLNYYSNNIE